jgi:diguanylate cyclase (GGDEF)-like protein
MNNELKKAYNSALRSSIEIILIYYFIGFLWIIFSDRLVKLFGFTQSQLMSVEVVKGILYVLVSGAFFYMIIKRRMDLYVNTIHNLEDTAVLLKRSNVDKNALEDKLYELAYFDQLTKLPNKIYLEEKIQQRIKENPDQIFGLFYFDLDDFRNINEFHGHDVGDELINEIAQLLKKFQTEKAIVARHNADEFMIAMFFSSPVQIKDIITKNLATVRRTFTLNNDDFFITISGGVAIYPFDGNTFKDLFVCADIAMSEAKLKGKDNIVYFNDQMRINSNRKIEILNLLHQALEQKEFKLHFQPIVSLESKKVVGVEALIRWFSKQKGYIPPLDFIPLAERSGNIREISEWVFKEAVTMQNKLDALGYPIKISINVSAKALMSPKFLQAVSKLVKETKADPTRIELELTETALIEDIRESIRILKSLKQMGFIISIDDFGTGYSSLAYLHKLPIDILKIDRTFIHSVTTDTEIPVVEFMVNIAKELDLSVIMEGVETEIQERIVKRYGCQYAQGYYYSMPLDETDLIAFMTNEASNE